MKKTNEIFFLILILTIHISCQHHDDSKYFNGEIRIIEDIAKEVKEVTLKCVPLNGANYGFVSVYDSLMFFMNPKLNDHFFNLFNVNTGEEMGIFCRKGSAPEEAAAFGPIFQFFKKEGDLKTLLFAPNEEKLFIWNLSQSAKDTSTIIDQIIPYALGKENQEACYKEIYLCDDSTLLAKVSSIPLNEKEATLPFYQKRTLYTNKLLKNYSIYKQAIKNDKASIISEAFFYSNDALKPDGTKVAQAMLHLPQLNILDLETGKVVGYRMKGGEDFSIFNGKKNIKNYFTYLQADNDYIYAVYWGKKRQEVYEISYINMIYIFDWHGKLVKKVKTDCDIDIISLDIVRNRLYVTSPTNNEVLYLDLKEIGLR